jgi:iodotyrosine deiodinase
VFAVNPVGRPAPDCEVPDLLVRKSLDQVLVEI